MERFIHTLAYNYELRATFDFIPNLIVIVTFVLVIISVIVMVLEKNISQACVTKIDCRCEIFKAVIIEAAGEDLDTAGNFFTTKHLASPVKCAITVRMIIEKNRER